MDTRVFEEDSVMISDSLKGMIDLSDAYAREAEVMHPTKTSVAIVFEDQDGVTADLVHFEEKGGQVRIMMMVPISAFERVVSDSRIERINLVLGSSPIRSWIYENGIKPDKEITVADNKQSLLYTVILKDDENEKAD